MESSQERTARAVSLEPSGLRTSVCRGGSVEVISTLGGDVVLPEVGGDGAAFGGELAVVAQDTAHVLVAGDRPELPSVGQHLVVQGRLGAHQVPHGVRVAGRVEVQVEQVDGIEVDVARGTRRQSHVRALSRSISSATRAGVWAR